MRIHLFISFGNANRFISPNQPVTIARKITPDRISTVIREFIYDSNLVGDIECNAIIQTATKTVFPSNRDFPTTRMKVAIIGLGYTDTQSRRKFSCLSYHIFRISDEPVKRSGQSVIKKSPISTKVPRTD